MSIKQKINEFLCKYAQEECVDKYGNIIRKPNGMPYKKGKVTLGNAVINLVIIPLIIIVILIFISAFFGYLIGKEILSYLGLNINISLYVDYIISGLILILFAIIFAIIWYYIMKLLRKLLNMEIASCPNFEEPPERKKCEKCGAPLPYENEELRVTVKNRSDSKKHLGYCDICKAPILHNDEEYNLITMSYKMENK